MSATTSAIPAAKAGLVAVLAARPGLAGVQVTYGWMGPETRAESIYLDPPEGSGDSTSTIPVMTAGRKRREEEFTITVVTQVVQEGGTVATAATTEARCYALFAELEGALADDPSLGLSVSLNATMRAVLAGHTRLLVPAQNGWSSRIDATVDCHVRLL